jgi:hypothetical protein
MAAAVIGRRVVIGADRPARGDRLDAVRNRMERLQVVMSEWVDWMRRDDSRTGFPSHSPLLRGASGDIYERAESERAELIDTVVSQDLEPIHCAAICKRYGVCAVWQFPRNNYAEVLEAAHEVLIAGLHKKGIDIDL